MLEDKTWPCVSSSRFGAIWRLNGVGVIYMQWHTHILRRRRSCGVDSGDRMKRYVVPGLVLVPGSALVLVPGPVLVPRLATCGGPDPLLLQAASVKAASARAAVSRIASVPGRRCLLVISRRLPCPQALLSALPFICSVSRLMRYWRTGVLNRRS